MEYVRDGWNLPGDTFLMDEDGYLFYQARSDDMIISAGYNIAGPEVEDALLSHPAVAECGVIGAPDPDRGHAVKAFVVLRPDFRPSPQLARELQEHVKQSIAPYKYPRLVEFVESLPSHRNGKAAEVPTAGILRRLPSVRPPALPGPRSSRRRILPTLVLGRSERNSIYRGFL
jgi:2-aminobenzoate-CoA ligase